MPVSNVTINDIARELKVAPSTISRALNNKSQISEKTKKLVRQKAAELGYDINLVASSLSKNKTNIIGVLLPNINRYFFSQVVSGIESVAYDKGYQIIIAQTNESLEREIEVTRMFNSTRVAGVIACLSVKTTDVSHLEKLKKNGIPLVLFDRVDYSLDCQKIIVDNFDGAFQAVSHLIKIGCKKIAHLGGPSDCKVFQERARGFSEALEIHKIQLWPNFLLATDLTHEDVRGVFSMWMTAPQKPDGVFVAGSDAGLMLTKMAVEAGIKVPDELAIVAFGDEPANEYICPSLSAVEMPGYDMGRTAVSQLFDAVEGRYAGSGTTVKPLQLIVRRSSFKRE